MKIFDLKISGCVRLLSEKKIGALNITRHTGTSAHKHLNTSAHRRIGTSAHRHISTLFFFLLTTYSFSQEIPLGTWRAHISYNAINSVAVGNQLVFGAAQNGVMALDRNDKSLDSYSRLNGLNGTGITFIAFSQSTNQLLVSYEDGKIDIIQDKNIKGLDPTSTTPVTGSKRINHIVVRNNLAYLAADYGVVVIDLLNAEIKETWRDLGVSGATLKIIQSTFQGDSVFLATEKGVLAGDLDNNLLDFNVWKRFASGDFNGPIQSIASFNNKIYAAINTIGLYRYQNGVWSKESFLVGNVFQTLTASAANLLICESGNLWKLNASNSLSPVDDGLITNPLFATEDSNGKLWIGDGSNGLVSDFTGAFERYLPNGPANATTFRMNYSNGRMLGLGGGYSTTFQALGKEGILDEFKNGVWSSSSTSMKDLTDIAVTTGSDKNYISSFGYGVEQRNGTTSEIVYDQTNSPLVNLNPPGKFVNITALENSSQGLWVANYGTNQSLHLLKGDNTWQSFSSPISPARYPTDLLLDFYDNLWMSINPAQGGGIYVFNRDDNAYTYINDVNGNGGLPSKSVRSMAIDREGLVWVGTDIGVAYFYDPSDDAVKPIFESRFLLRDDKVTAIAVDGGNRKWMGTERGVWLFNPTGEELIYNFTTANSPLLSNVIRDIEIQQETGEVFFITDKGVVSFRGESTEGNVSFQTIKIFPNPVTSDFNGTVAISGLATDAIVKITDVSGKLIWQTQANGGMATWNVEDYNGRHASTGVYIVFAATQDGAESVVGKIAVVE